MFPLKDDAWEEIPLSAMGGGHALPPIVTLDPVEPSRGPDPVPDLDLVVELSPHTWDGDLYRISRFGAWTCYSPLEDRAGFDRKGRREVWDGEPVTAVTLSALTSTGTPRVLARAWFQTDPLSPERNRNRLHWKQGSLISQELGEARLRRHLLAMERASGPSDDAEIPAPPQGSPVGPGLVRSAFRTLRSVARRKRDYWLYADQWILLYQRMPAIHIPSSLDDLQRIVPPPDRFWADPHVVKRHGRYYVFLEEYLYSTRLGHISVMEIDDEGGFTDPVPVLSGDDHLSYPFVFEHDGEMYMIPETLARRSIELYRCRRFPDQWDFVHTLMDDIDAVDATVTPRGGRWWLFVAVRSDPGSSVSEDLHLFYADDPLARNWTEHPDSPVVRDPRRARPAGGLFEMDGRLFRPGQIGVPRYGYGISLHEVTAMTDEIYEERLDRSIAPSPASPIVGSHTISWAPGLLVMDAILRQRVDPLASIVRRVRGSG